MHRKSVVRMSSLDFGGKAVFHSEAVSLRRRVEQQPCARDLIGASAKRARGIHFLLPSAGPGQWRLRPPCAGRMPERRRWRRMRLCRVAPSTRGGSSRSTHISRLILAAPQRASEMVRPQGRTGRKRRADITAAAHPPDELDACGVHQEVGRVVRFCKFNMLGSRIPLPSQMARPAVMPFRIAGGSAGALSVVRFSWSGATLNDGTGASRGDPGMLLYVSLSVVRESVSDHPSVCCAESKPAAVRFKAAARRC